MLDFRRALLLMLLACASCEGGPTSEWPSGMEPGGNDDKDDDGEGTPRADAGSSGGLDASVPLRDASVPLDDGDCVPDAGDAGADDAGCLARDD